MSTYDDFDGVFFSIQAMKMYHPVCQSDIVEFVILDNNPDSTHGKACKDFANGKNNIRYIECRDTPSSFNKYKIVDYATGRYVLIMDCHVLIQNNGIMCLLNYFNENLDCKNLVQGPLLYDDLVNTSTHFDAKWSGDMYGVWASDNKNLMTGKPFEIQMQGMGLLAFERKNWPGINQHFRGFGGEEGYIAEKFRQAGGKNICLPALKWNHRFGRPAGVKYPLVLEDRIWNYFIGWLELTKDPEHEMIKSIREYFTTRVPEQTVDIIFKEAKKLILKKGKNHANSI